MVVTMTLSDVMNNTATAVIAAPIALEVAERLGASPDPFLMAVAVAASCAFLTPIGHKNNTLIMGPGGYRFGDYWRMGLPLELLIVGGRAPDDPGGLAAVKLTYSTAWSICSSRSSNHDSDRQHSRSQDPSVRANRARAGSARRSSSPRRASRWRDWYRRSPRRLVSPAAPGVSPVGQGAPKASSSYTTTSTIPCPTIFSICLRARVTSLLAIERCRTYALPGP